MVGKGESSSKGGKKSDLLAVNGAYGTFSGIYLCKDKILSYLIDFTGNVLERETEDLPELSADRISEAVVEKITADRKRYSNHRGVGITVQSAVNKRGGIVVSPGFDIEIPGFKDFLKKEVGDIPIVVENDANCSAYYCFNQYKGRYRHLLAFLVYFDPFSMGVGIISDRKLLRGTSGGAGEIWRPKDNIMEKYLHRYDHDLNRVLHAADLDVLLTGLRRYILSAWMFLDTQLMILCGDLSSLPKEYLDMMIESMQRECKGINIVFEERNDLSILGAAQLSTELYLNRSLAKIA